MKRILSYLIIGIAISFFCCLPYSCKQKKSDIETVRVAQFGDFFIYMPLYLADEKGFFEEEKIKIELINTGGDDKTFAALISKSAIFGIADPTFAAIAAERGQGGKVIASIVNGVPFWGIAKVNSDVPLITEPQHLAGFKVATFPSPSTSYTLQAEMFRNGKLEPNIRQVSSGSLYALIENGDADIALELEPNVSTIIKKNNAKIVYSLADIYGDFAITGVTVLNSTIDKNPELVQRFVNAINKAERYAHTYPDSAAYYAMKRFPDLDSDIVIEAMNRILRSNTLPQNAIISKAAWTKAIQLRKDAGDLRSIDDAQKILDMSFAEKSLKGSN